MSKDASSSSSSLRSATRSNLESNENDADTLFLPFPPPRTPLNSITDPSQCQTHPTALNKSETTRSLRGKSHSEPNSAQTTPLRRISNVFTCSGARYSMNTGPKGANKTSKGTPVINSEPSVQVPHFELAEDPSFWKDHNVQVLIRVRPLNNTEKASQGYGRCLRQESAQTLVWLGHPETRFTFDHVACETISQEKLFRVAGLPMVDNCMSGYNSCMFAYGQTGSGKTYTMMGDIGEMSGKLCEQCGITPRIFEYLFTRIREEEDKRKNERLKYSCKCSFLEIYNEQITDLLEPSSTNLLLREDLKKGVYVENLTEISVSSVDDVLRILLQGAANRKMAATHMNTESSRSHSVFTCNIESCWEKDSMKHFRFGRLNLVDLAGSERQKSSGAEGDRLKEAANINKSLSTLGLVIMSLVDLAHGKHRHVPYRDSRLTFLLQDSLGGNSKTAVIANISPSICSASETLSTLKFAQRAKLIQNNAKINEDASGDVSALQQQIQKLKGQLSFLLKHQGAENYFTESVPCLDRFSLGDCPESFDLCEELNMHTDRDPQHGRSDSLHYPKATLFNAVRRAKLAEMEVRRLEAEIEEMKHLVHQQEEEVQLSKEIMKLRDKKIDRLESLGNGVISADSFILEENNALKDEIQLLQARAERNPESARLAYENISLLKQLRWFENFYENGETEKLVPEMSELREQERVAARELKECGEMNSKLIREVDELQGELGKHVNFNQAAFDSVETMSIEADKAKRTRHDLPAGGESKSKEVQDAYGASISQHKDIMKQLIEARSLMEAMEQEQVQLIEELEFMREENQRLSKQMRDTERAGIQHMPIPDTHESRGSLFETQDGNGDLCMVALQAKLEKMSKDLEEARLLNSQYLEDHALKLSQEHQTELVREEVEIETSKTILHTQEEIVAMKSELQEKLCLMADENMSLKNSLAAKEEEIKVLRMEWERATLELTNFLIDGSKSLRDASSQIENIACSFPDVNACIGEHVERAAKICIEKEETILLLKRSLEEAQRGVLQMDEKLNSLRGATMAFTQAQQLDNEASNKEAIQLVSSLDDQINRLEVLEKNLLHRGNHIAEVHAVSFSANDGSNSTDSNLMKGGTSSESLLALTAHENNIELARLELLEVENAVNALCFDAQNYLSGLQSDAYKMICLCKEFNQEFLDLIHQMRNKFYDLIENGSSQYRAVGFPSCDSSKLHDHDKQHKLMHQIRYELVETNEILNQITTNLNRILNSHLRPDTTEDPSESDGWTTDSSASCSYLSSESVALGKRSNTASLSGNSQSIPKNLNLEDTSLFHLRREFKMAYSAFAKINAQFNSVFNEKGEGDCSTPVLYLSDSAEFATLNDQHPISNQQNEMTRSHKMMMHGAEVSCKFRREEEFGDNISEEKIFFKKFEQAFSTIKEVDYTSNALVKVNENEKHLTSMLRQAEEELLAQKASLVEDVKQLKSTIRQRDEEKGILQDEACRSLIEISNRMSLLEGSFVDMQKNVEGLLKTLFADASRMAEETLGHISNSKSLLEGNFSGTMKNEISSSVLYHCQAIDSIHELERSCKIGMIMDEEKLDGMARFRRMEDKELGLNQINNKNENLELRKELERKELLLKGLLFDISLLQESASSRKDITDEVEKLTAALNRVQNELSTKERQLDEMFIQHRTIENRMQEMESALFASKAYLEVTRRESDNFSKQNSELRALLEDLCVKKSQTEGELEEQREIVKSLENEILRLTSSTEKQLILSKKDRDTEDDLKRVTGEKNQLLEQLQFLQDRLDMAYSLADENKAIAVQARQVSEASKMYAEEKDEEVKILEHSVEELEGTINVLESKVHEMEEEVQRDRLIRDSLELELQALRKRLLMVENSQSMDISSGELSTKDQFLRLMEPTEAYYQIGVLEEEKAELTKEIKQCKDYISEILLHAQAQASQYQQKYKELEAVVHGLETHSINTINGGPTSDKTEKCSTRLRGSSSPFRCISSLVQQMNSEKDQELSAAKFHIEELEVLLAQKQKEICMMNSRLAATESMTHDVIRDLLGVKLDMTSYSNLMNQYQVQKFVEEAQQQSEELIAMERQLSNLRRQIDDLVEERERFTLDAKEREADVLSSQMCIEQLRERDQMLTAQNEMLKMDRTNLQRKIVELDDMVKKLLGRHSQIGGLARLKEIDVSQRLGHPQKLVLGARDKLCSPHEADDNQNGCGTETKFR
ncbi:kinesin-like protein KIN-12C isoform X1 [Lycium ferocissimum]|uniref:kinesin-like protein KIN-12C isoform X1 n=1 Tax=Lycium ferocissimum TaxID=112874 RepID=UPI00281518A8|nr:kinesin-like protein KIN-12C isoform X1 [Lycium ferocissimum]